MFFSCRQMLRRADMSTRTSSMLTPPCSDSSTIASYQNTTTTTRPPSPHPSSPSNAHSYPSPAPSSLRKMTTPHRGLPPPHYMTLPDPSRGPPQMPAPMESLPPAPQQWSGASNDDSMRSWLRAKEEDDRRKQEEQRTHQEELKLEQRRVEQSMLREALTGGIPPHLVPVLFAGLAGGPLAQLSFDLVQQHLAQLQQAGHPSAVVPSAQVASHPPPPPPQPPAQHYAPTQHTPPHARRDSRPHIQSQPGPHLPPGVQQGTVYPSPAYQSPAAKAATYGPPTALQYGAPAPPRAAAQAALPHLTTNEVAPQSTAGYPQEQPSPSPNIYFHHWQPPGTATAAAPKEGDAKKTSPSSSQQLVAEEVQPSPRHKRKAAGPHQPAPPPTTTAATTSKTSPTNSAGSAASKEGRHVPPQQPSQHVEQRATYDPIGEGRQRRANTASRPQSRHASSPPRTREMP